MTDQNKGMKKITITAAPNNFPAHLVQENQQKTLRRLPSVLGKKAGNLVRVPSGETLLVGKVLFRDKSKERRCLLLTNKTGGIEVFPIRGGGNVFH